jgi:hypothetical protein
MIGESSSRTDVEKENLVSLYLSNNWNILSRFDWYDRSFGVGVEFPSPFVGIEERCLTFLCVVFYFYFFNVII